MMETPEKISDRNPFRVPENYFGEVNRKIFAATTEKDLETFTVFRRIRPFMAAAAAIAVLVTAAYFSVKLFSPHTPGDLSDLNTPESTELLINELDITTIENDVSMLGIPDENPGLSAADIINDLIEENIDINEIYERL